MIHGAEATTPQTHDLDRSLRESFGAFPAGEIHLFSEYIDAGRFEGVQQARLQAAYFRERYAEKQVDLIFAAGTLALAFLTRYRDEIFPGIPIVFMEVRQETLDNLKLPRDVIGVGTELEAVPAVALALRLRPASREVVILAGASELDRIWDARLRQAAAKVAPGLPVRSLSGLSIEQIERELAALTPESVVVGGTFRRDGAGRFFQGSVPVLERVSAVAGAPIFHVAVPAVGRGAVGSVGLPPEEMSRQAAGIAQLILAGVPAEAVALPKPLTPRTQVDWRQIQRWNISQDLVPADAVVLFRDLSFWDQYHFHVLAVAVLILLETSLIAALLIEARKRRRAELLAHGQRQELARLSRVTLLASMSVSVAHELSQPLGAILTNAQAARLFLKQDPADLAEADESLLAIIRSDHRAGEIITNLRKMLLKKEVSRQALSLNELLAELLKLLDSELNLRRTKVEVDVADDCPSVLADRTQLLQVLINLVINACDAMQSTAPSERLVVIRAETVDRRVLLRVEDHGSGVPNDLLDGKFAPFVTTKANGLGMGLSICRSIVESHGGKLSVTNKASGGAIFAFDLPIVADRMADRELERAGPAQDR
ncbi:MAG: GHKL domain-containing protein [Chitinophagaceae bacterium]|nr:GHKL domain-containing protein [Rubrivivax sp.]